MRYPDTLISGFPRGKLSSEMRLMRDDIPPVVANASMLFLPTSQDSSVTPCDFQNDS
jgi:hypothetical protein